MDLYFINFTNFIGGDIIRLIPTLFFVILIFASIVDKVQE